MYLKAQQHIFLTLLVAIVVLVPVTAAASQTGVGTFDNIVWNVINSVFGSLAALAGLLVNAAVNNFVIDFTSNDAIMKAVDTLWVTVRDIFNLTFIFGLVFIGIRIILDSDNSNTRRWLVHIILAALLVNFSLFITKAVIDFSNILATQIAVNGFRVDSEGDVLISESFQDVVATNKIWDMKSIVEDKAKIQDGGVYGYMFGAMIIFIVQIFTFASGALILLVRFTVLLLYMILSPLMFLGWVFPQLESMVAKYWHGFLSRAFVAPIYILILYFAAYIIQRYFATLENLNYAKALNSSGGKEVYITFEDTIPPFIVSSIFLIAAVVIANKMGDQGASAALSIGKNITNRAKRAVQRGTVNTAKFAAAQTGGRLARRGSYAIGTSLDRQLNRMKNADGNTRRGKIARAIGGSVVVNDAMGGTAKKLKDQKFGLKYTRDEATARKASIDKEINNNDKIKQGLAAREELKREDLDPETKKNLENDVAALQQTIGNYSVDQLEKMYQQSPEQFKQIVGDMKTGQFDKLMDSKNLNQKQIGEIYTMRSGALIDAVKAGDVIFTDKLKNYSIKQIETMGDDFLREHADKLTQKQFDDVLKSDNFSEVQRDSYFAARKNNLSKAAQTDPNAIFKLVKGVDAQGKAVYGGDRKADEIGSMPLDVFFINGDTSKPNQQIISRLTRNHLEAIPKKDVIKVAERDLLRDEILKNGSDDVKGYLYSYNGSRNWNMPNTEGNKGQNNPAPKDPEPEIDTSKSRPEPRGQSDASKAYGAKY